MRSQSATRTQSAQRIPQGIKINTSFMEKQNQINHTDKLKPSEPGQQRSPQYQKIYPHQQQSINLQKQRLQVLPIDIIEKLSQHADSIKYVDLSHNKLRLFPKELISLRRVEVINLNSNFIQVIDHKVFTGLTSLQQFFVSNNILQEINKSIENWAPSLIILDISLNKIRFIGESISKLVNLQ